MVILVIIIAKQKITEKKDFITVINLFKITNVFNFHPFIKKIYYVLENWSLIYSKKFDKILYKIKNINFINNSTNDPF